MSTIKFFLILIILVFTVNAQVFNTAQTLKPGKGSLGITAAIIDGNSNSEFGVFFNGGYGLSRGLDLGAKIGIGFDETYFGLDLEYVLRGISPYISVAGGAHMWGDPGLDGTLNFTFPLNRQLKLYSGLDLDINFVEVGDGRETFTPFWWFIGTEVAFKKNMTLLFEMDLDLNDDAYSIFNFGLNFYL